MPDQSFQKGLIEGTRLPFLPASLRASYDRWYHSGIFVHFSIVYMFRDFLVLIALAYFFRSERQEKQIGHMKEQQLQAELTYLIAQLQPHFFFNTLNNIYSLALQQSTETAPLIARLSDMMRYVLYDAAKIKVPLSREADFIKNYTEVQAVRYPGKVAIHFDTQGIHENAVIEPLLFLPFVENAFKYGGQEELGKGFIEILICMMGNELTLEVKNSKANSNRQLNGSDSSLVVQATGGDARERNHVKGIGIENAVKRLALLYPGRHALEISDGASRYEVLLTLNLN